MNIHIHTFIDPLFTGGDTRNASVWAVAGVEGQKVEDGVLASGTDDRSASNAALAAFWKREDTKAQVHNEERVAGNLLDSTAPPLATTRGAIQAMVQRALDTDPRDTLRIDYRDANGNYTSRLFVPSQIDGDLLTGYDIARDDARTFRFDRISSAEVVR